MQLREQQARVNDWILEVARGYWGDFEVLARLTEELGELSAALQREAGLRPRKANVDVASEMGDVLFTLLALANLRQIDLQSALDGVFEKYDVRDGDAWRQRKGD